MAVKPPKQTWVAELEAAVEAARAGAGVVRAAFGTTVDAEFKGDANPVTEIDRAAEARVLTVIRRDFPHDEVLAEEGGGGGWDRGRAWIVDPLDGTVNFIHAVPTVAVSVALWIDGAPAVGVVIDVTREEEFTATVRGGAFLNGQPIRVSPERELGQSLIATGFPYDRNLHGMAYATNMGEVLTRVQGIRRGGSAALDLAWVACGRYDGYWEFGIQPWDAGAGVLLVMEAMGFVSNHRGLPHRLDDPAIVATNGSIHSHLLAAIQIALPPHVV